jgi:pyridoxal phosphate enzyme (YggS family)
MLFEKNKLRLSQVRQKISHACQDAGRQNDAVSLLAITKNQSVEAILPLLEAGHRLFGENRVQEAAAKWATFRKTYPDIKLHYIGPLQTNKVKQALELFDVIESVDRPRLVETIAREWPNSPRLTQKILIQVNTGQEVQKSGVSPENLADLINSCRLHGMPVTGLMCIPPSHEDPGPHFQLLADLTHEYNLPDLSMGMSNDYALAIAKGATQVRIGTALFEPQP